MHTARTTHHENPIRRRSVMTCSGRGLLSGSCQESSAKDAFLNAHYLDQRNRGAVLKTRSQIAELHRPPGDLEMCTGWSFTSAPPVSSLHKHALTCNSALLHQQRPRLCHRGIVRAQGTSLPSMPAAVQREVLTKRERSFISLFHLVNNRSNLHAAILLVPLLCLRCLRHRHACMQAEA